MLSKEDWSNIKFSSLGDLSLPFEDNEIRFLVSSDNDLKVNYNGQAMPMNMGDFILINRHSNCGIIGNGDNHVIIISFFINREDYSGELYTHIFENLEINSCQNKAKTSEEIKEILKEIVNIKVNSQEFIRADIREEYYRLVALLFKKYAKDVPQKSNHASRIDRVKEYLDLNYKKNLPLTEVAAKFDFSAPYLSRLFKNTFKQSFKAYLANLRIENARLDMLQTDKKLIDIAYSNGFPNVGSFNAAFKGKYHLTPSVYRKKSKFDNKNSQTAREYIVPKNQMKDLIGNQHSQNVTTIRINNDQINAISGMKEPWRQLINVGEASSFFSKNFHEQLQNVQKDIGFKYGRIWGLFADIMVDSNNLKFSKIDEVIDTLLSNKLIPFIELGNKPLKINRNYKEVIQRPAHLRTATVYKQFLKFFTKFLIHCIAKYGKEEVSKWNFEYWYPSVSVMNNKYMPDVDKTNIEGYLKNFDSLYSIIKKYSPLTHFGGCGLSTDLDIRSADTFLKAWHDHHLPDFVSIYVYNQDFDKGSTDDSGPRRLNATSSDIKDLLNKIIDIKKLIETDEINKPLYVTEWNISISDFNYVNDSLFKANFLLNNIIQNLDNVDILGYWRMSDITDYLDTGYLSDYLFTGGVGLITKDGIKKPAYYAFEFLRKMNGDVLYNKDNIMITSNGLSGLNILIMNYKYFNTYYSLIRENELHPERLYKIFGDETELNGEIVIKDLKSGNYYMHRYVLGQGHGDPLKKYIDWGFPKDVEKEELDYLKQTCLPDLQLKLLSIKKDFSLKYSLKPNEIYLYQLWKV